MRDVLKLPVVLKHPAKVFRQEFLHSSVSVGSNGCHHNPLYYPYLYPIIFPPVLVKSQYSHCMSQSQKPPLPPEHVAGLPDRHAVRCGVAAPPTVAAMGKIASVNAKLMFFPWESHVLNGYLYTCIYATKYVCI